MKVVILTIVILLVSVTVSNSAAAIPDRNIQQSDFATAANETGDGDIDVTGVSVRAIPRTEPVPTNFSITIGKIGLNKKVVANVNPASKAEYLPVIEEAVAHGKYTRLPDEAVTDGNVYLFAHREGAAGFFNRLGELRSGDSIKVYYQGRTFTYKVYKSFVVNKNDTWVYTAQSNTPTLTLQTCENGTEDRLIVKARLSSVV